MYAYAGADIEADAGLPTWFQLYATVGENGLSLTYETWRDLFGGTQDDLYALLAGRIDRDAITLDRMTKPGNEGGVSPTYVAQADQVFRDRWSVEPTTGGEGGTPPADPPPPEEAADPLPTGDNSIAETGRRIHNQYFNLDVKRHYVRALRNSVLYGADEAFRTLVERYATQVEAAQISPLPPAAQSLLVGPVAPTNEYVQSHPAGPDAITAVDARLAQLLGPVRLRNWHEVTARTEREIAVAKEQAAVPRVYRFLGGMGMAAANAISGTVEAVAYFDRIPAGLWSLMTDVDTQARVIEAIIEKFSDGSAENIGELTVEVPLAVAGGAGAVRTGAAAVTFSGKLVVRVSRETVAAIRAATPEARAGLQLNLRGGVGDRPLRPSGTIEANGGSPWRRPSRATLEQAELIRVRDNLDPAQLVTNGLQQVSGRIRDADLLILAESLQLEVFHVSFVTPSGQRGYILVVGEPRRTGVVYASTLQEQYPGARLQTAIHAHPPGGTASRADYLYAFEENTSLSIVDRLPDGRTRTVTITPDDAARYFIDTEGALPTPNNGGTTP